MAELKKGIKRQYTSVDVLQSVEDFFKICGASCKLNSSTFSVDVNAFPVSFWLASQSCFYSISSSMEFPSTVVQIVASSDQCNTISKNGITDVDSARSHIFEKQSMHGSSLQVPEDNLSFRILVCLVLIYDIPNDWIHHFKLAYDGKAFVTGLPINARNVAYKRIITAEK